MIKQMVYWLWTNFKSHITTFNAHIANSAAHHTDHQAASTEYAEFKSVNIASGEAYKQNGKAILKTKTIGNIFIGEEAGNDVTTGNRNILIGHQSGFVNTSGHTNTFIGYRAGYVNVNGGRNVFIAPYGGYANVNGNQNTFIGPGAGESNVSGSYNIFLGANTGFKNISGHRNTHIGYDAGSQIISKNDNVCIGYQAGRNTTESKRLYIACEASNEKTLIHGEFDNKRLFMKGAASAPADVKLHNSDINFWLDEVNDKLQIKVKKSDGTVLTGFVQLA